MKRLLVLSAFLFLPSFPASAQDARPDFTHPTTFVCVPKLNPVRHPIPAGKQLKDLCSPGTSALLFPGPGTVIHPTTFACFPQPQQPPRPIPPGKEKNVDDLCPPGDTAWLFPNPVPASSLLPNPPMPTGSAPPQPDTGKKTP
jgi:hypothetical protein